MTIDQIQNPADTFVIEARLTVAEWAEKAILLPLPPQTVILPTAEAAEAYAQQHIKLVPVSISS